MPSASLTDAINSNYYINMKKGFLGLAILVLAISCKEPFYDKQDFSSPKNAPLAFECVAETTPGTSKTWEESDAVGVFSDQALLNNTSAPLSASSIGMEQGVFNVDFQLNKVVENYDFAVYYPYDKNNETEVISFDVPSSYSQLGSSSSYLSSSNLFVANTVVDPKTYKDFVHVELKPILSIHDLSLITYDYRGWTVDKVGIKAPGTVMSGRLEYNVITNENEFKTSQDSITINVANMVLSEEDRHLYYLHFQQKDSLDYDATLSVYLSKDESNIVLIGSPKLASASFVSIDNFEKHEIGGEVIDLSNPTGKGPVETANCYVAGLAGRTYKFPATIMGNGYTTPADTTYSPSSEGSAPGIIPTTLEPDNVKILWQTEKSLLTNIKLKNGYIHFTVNGSGPSDFKSGNAVIAAYKNNVIIWTWHIWVTDVDLDSKVQTWKINSAWDVYSNYSNPILMDRNLGALSASEYSSSGTNEAKGLFYQWGRKDPFIGPDNSSYNSRVAVLTYDAENKTIAKMASSSAFSNDVKWTYVAKKLSREDIAKYPMTFISGASNYFWLNEVAHDLWGCPGYADESNNIGHKTIYDPCPPGYRVMNAYALTGVISTKEGGTWASAEFHYAVNPSTYKDDGSDLNVYYDHTTSIAKLPAGGLVYFEKSASYFPFDRVGTYGYYWTSKMTSTMNYRAYRMHFDYNNFVSMEKSYASYGHSVRCEKIK